MSGGDKLAGLHPRGEEELLATWELAQKSPGLFILMVRLALDFIGHAMTMVSLCYREVKKK